MISRLFAAPALFLLATSLAACGGGDGPVPPDAGDLPDLCADVACEALDQCHVAGVCDPATGECSNPAAADGTACDDDNACTQADTCSAGTCVGADPVVCTALDQCHEAGVCDPATGECSNPAAADGTACDDDNACTQADTCSAGACVGADPVVCTALDQCHEAGVCDPATGECSNPEAPNGTSCNDGNACTQTDACSAGTCVGADPVTCTALDQCHEAGVCDPGTGVCSNPEAANGTSCNDGNACTQADSCQAGACVGDIPVVCTALDQCHKAGVCNPDTGACTNPILADGTSCNDGNACTQTDSCQAGACVGADPVVCTALDQCHQAGVCNPGTGVCSNPEAPNGTSCDDGDACTQIDTCALGTCVGDDPVSCMAIDQCHEAGVCDPGTGACSNPIAADGTFCNDDDPCTQTGACMAGACVGANPVTCMALSQCHEAGVCDPGTGVCSNPLRANGSFCNDGDACTQTDACSAGMCVGANPVTCTAFSQCHQAGVCDPGTGVCSNPVAPDGTSCETGDVCTTEDTCQAGICFGWNACEQTLISENFEGVFPGDWLRFETTGQTPDSTVRYAADGWVIWTDFRDQSNKAAVSTSWFQPEGQADAWMVTPGIHLPPDTRACTLTWSALAQDPAYRDGYEVRVFLEAPTEANLLSSVVVFAIAQEESQWTARSIDLSEYIGETINIGWRNNSNNMFLLFVDNVVMTCL